MQEDWSSIRKFFSLSEKYEGGFTEEDEKHLIMFAELVSETLEALWDDRNLRKSQV
ncbi:MAG: hypothetical protein KME25_33350 [Symplocastrum torsivum CPER-KK1]|uniref:Uncharacterized protein n=1 Tax=Symplocastrum torsivum CPER-KK1 TaxID=450513 RepID=A0A951PUI8_9CYAN|nr:hypothetical protein [Symplocastrum torsivum CPER-KK1]